MLECLERHRVTDLSDIYFNFLQTAEVLKELWKREHRARVEEWLDNVSSVLLSTFELSAEEQELVQALEDKYDVLR